MNKMIFILVTWLMIGYCDNCYAQPIDQPITYSVAQRLITNFQTTVTPTPYPRHPSSFLFNAADLIAYFKTSNLNYPCYLHVYFAANGAPQPNNIFLVVVGAYTVGATVYHDPYMTNVIYSSYAYSEPNCGTSYDPSLDGMDKYKGTVNRCKPVTISKQDNTLKTWINNYQSVYKQAQGHTQSFVINATSLRDYLLYPNGTAQFIHAYIGYDANNSALDHLTLVMVGIDGTGVDVPASIGNDGLDYAFDEVMPCPTCNAVPDVFDKEPQFILGAKANNLHKQGKQKQQNAKGKKK